MTEHTDLQLDERASALAIVAGLQWLQFRTAFVSSGVAGASHGPATLVPPPTGTDDHTHASYVGGVADKRNRFDPQANHYSSISPWVRSAGKWRGRAKARLEASSVLYGGVAREHFGHFVTESLGRLWPLYVDSPDKSTPAPPHREFDGVAFLRSPIGAPSTEGLALLKQFDGMPPVTVVDNPTRVSRVFIPAQSSASESGMIGLRPPMQALRSQLARQLPPSTERSIYVSRSRWNPGPRDYSGSILQERQLEELLSAVGYEIFHPQEHTVANQIATYRSAGRIVVNESSAIHLVALSAPKDARVAVIGRRPVMGPLLDGYLETAFGRSALTRFIECGDRYTISGAPEVWLALRLPELCRELVARGLLPDSSVWRADDLRLIELEQRRDLLGRDGVISRSP